MTNIALSFALCYNCHLTHQELYISYKLVAVLQATMSKQPKRIKFVIQVDVFPGFSFPYINTLTLPLIIYSKCGGSSQF